MTTIAIEGAWYSGPATEHPHFVPAGLPVALCGEPRGPYQWPSGLSGDLCPECDEARGRIEGEMLREATQQTTPPHGGES